jgi:hypothetical protein
MWWKHFIGTGFLFWSNFGFSLFSIYINICIIFKNRVHESDKIKLELNKTITLKYYMSQTSINCVGVQYGVIRLKKDWHTI